MTGVLSGTGGFAKGGTGLLILGASNTYTGQTQIQAGTLSVGSLNYVSSGSWSNHASWSGLGVASSASNGMILMGNAGTTGNLTYTGSGETTDRSFQIGVNSATPLVSDSGSAIIENDGAGALVFTSGTFNAQTVATTGTGANRTLTLQGSNTGTIQGVIQDNGVSGAGVGTATVSLVKAGAGTWNLNGANTYTGSTLVSSGTLNLNGTIAGSSVTVNGANFYESSTGSISGASVTLTASNATVTLAGSNTYGGATTISGGILNLQNSSALGTGTATMTSNAVLQLQSGSGIQVGNVIFNLAGSGIGNDGALRNISGSNTYSGALSLATDSRINSDSGTLYITSGSTALGNSILTVGGAGNTVIGSILSGSGGRLTKDGPGVLTLTASNSYTGVTDLSAGTLSIGDGTAGHDASIASSSGINLENSFVTLVYNLSSTATRTYSNVIYGQGSLTLSGSGSLTLAGTNTFTGNTLVTGGVLTLGNSLALQNSVLNTASAAGSITLGGTTATFGGLTGGGSLGSIINNYGTLSTLTLNNQDGINSIYSGNITNGAAGMNLVKSGSGTQTLSGSNSYTGATTVSGGTLVVGGSNALGTGDSISSLVMNGGSLDLGGYTVTVTGSGLIGSGTIGNNSSSGTSTLNISSTTNSVATFSGVIADNLGTGGGIVSLWLNGVSSEILSGIDTYSGATFVNGGIAFGALPGHGASGATAVTGILQITGSLTNTSSLTIANNGTLIDGNSTGTSNNGVTNRINPSVTLAMNGGIFTMAAPAVGNVTSQTFAGISSGSGVNIINANAATGTTNLIFSGPSGSVYNRALGSVIDFVTGTGAYNISFTNAPSTNGAGSGSDAILVGAFLSGTDFIADQAGILTAATYTVNGTNSFTAGKNINVTGTNTSGLTGLTSINSLRFNDAVQRTVALTSGTLSIASGGIIVGANNPQGATGSVSGISGGALTSGTNELFISQLNSVNARTSYGFTIASQIVDNGSPLSLNLSSTSTSSGAGTIGLIALTNTANSFSGNIYLNNGALAILNSDGVLGASGNSVVVNSGIGNTIRTDIATWSANHGLVINQGAYVSIGAYPGNLTFNGALSGGGVLELGFYNSGFAVIMNSDQSGFAGTYCVGNILRANDGVGLSSNANLSLAMTNTGGLAGVLETSANFTRPLGTGAGQVQFTQIQGNSFGGGFSAVGGPVTISLGGLSTPASLTYGSGGFFNGLGAGGLAFSGLVLQDSNATNTLTWGNPINNNGTKLAVNQDASTSATNTQATMTGALSGAGGFLKGGSGLLVLTGSNSYTGQTQIGYGTLSVSSLNYVSSGDWANHGAGWSGLGAPTTGSNGTIILGSYYAYQQFNASETGTLLYTGAGETTDRMIQVGQNTATPSVSDTGSGVIENDGAGALVFTSGTFNAQTIATTGTGANRTLTLQGSNTGINTIQGIIQDNGVSGAGVGTAAISLAKSGVGTWKLTGNNTYTGATAVKAGTLIVSGSLSTSGTVTVGDSSNLATSAVLAGGGAIGNLILGAAAGNTGACLNPSDSVAESTGGGGTTLNTQSFTIATSGSATLALQIGRTTAGTSKAGDSSDRISVNGAVSLGTTGKLQLTLQTGYIPAINDVFYLIINGSSSTGSFASVNGSAISANTFSYGGATWDITYGAYAAGNSFTTGNDVAIRVSALVPEPSSWLLLVCGFGILCLVQRPRRHA